jgi:site-specific DNA recombinase
MSEPISAVAYYRMSDDDQANSIPRQREQVEPYAAREGYRLLSSYEDEGIPGDEFDGREGLQRLLKDARKGKFRTILVDELSRLSRQQTIDFIALVVKPLRDLGVGVVSVAEGPQSWDDVVALIMLVVRQDKSTGEVKSMARRVTGGMLRLAAAGDWIGGNIPHGLAVAGTGKARRLAAGEPDHAAAVKLIFELCGQGWALRAISGELYRRGIPSPAGKAVWNNGTIRKILRNRKYVGDSVWNTRRTGKYHGVRGGAVVASSRKEEQHQARDRGGRRGKKVRYLDRDNPVEDWVIARDTHEGLVSRALFEKCQQRLAENRKHTTPIRGGGDFLLTGLLVCGHCGHRLVGRTHKNNGKRYYLCCHYASAGRRACLGYNLREDRLLAAIVRRLREAVLNKDNLEKLREELRCQVEEDRRTAPAREAALRKRIAGFATRIGKALDRMQDIDKDLLPDYAARVRAMKEEKAKAEAELENVLHPPARVELETAVQAAEEQLELLDRNLANGEPPLVRDTLREIITKVEVWFNADRPEGRRYERYTFRRGVISFRPQEELDLSCLFTTPSRGTW